MSTIGKLFSDYLGRFWGINFVLSVLLLCALLLPYILSNTILADKQLECTFSDVLQQEDLQVRCRDNDAVILRSSFYVSNGKIYYLDKTKGEWGVRQTIDLEPYLKGWHTIHLSKNLRFLGDRLTKRLPSFSYNDKWLCVLLMRKPEDHRKFFRRERQNKVLIFKRDGNQWKFHYALALGNRLRDGHQTEVVHDQLLVVNPNLKKGQKRGAIQCFDLSGSKPNLCQTIYPPASSRHPREMGWLRFYVKDDLMLVCWDDLNSKELEKRFDKTYYVTLKDVIYRMENNRWELWQNLSETIPPAVFEKRSGRPTEEDFRVDLNDQEICIYSARDKKSVTRFVNREGKWMFADDVDYNPNASIRMVNKFTRVRAFTTEVGVQSPWSYNVVWRDKMQLLGVVKPSEDGKIRFVEPDWFFRDADPVTLQKMREHYSFVDYYHSRNVDYLKKDGYESYYDYADYIPLVDYSICGSTLVTSYTFDQCYFKGSLMQSADVWGGVNIYEIDSETGPKRVFSLKTGHLDELKPVPVDETILETNVPTLEESLAQKERRLAKNKEEYQKAHPGRKSTRTRRREAEASIY